MTFIHPQALCESEEIGKGTRVWAFAHVLPGARIGADCNICDGVFIENDVVMGERVTVKCGVQLWDGVELGDDVFVGPNATFTNDPFPRSKRFPERFARTVVEAEASVGANATILPGVRIGYGAMIGAGAVVTDDVPPKAIMVGNPGRVVGFAGAEKCLMESLPRDFAAKSVRWNSHTSSTGRLSVSDRMPFQINRIFTVDNVKPGVARGAHAHKSCHQLLKIIGGSIDAIVDDGERAFHTQLNDPDTLLYMPPGLWGMQFAHSPGATLMVFASDPYDAADYIRHYPSFLAHARSHEHR